MTRVFTTVVLLALLQAIASSSRIKFVGSQNGEKITLKCCTSEDRFGECNLPAQKVTWFRNHEPLHVGDGTVFVVNEKNKLSFPNRASYEAVYQCMGNSTENQGINVTANPTLEDHLPKQRLYVAENASLTLSCPIEVGNISKKYNSVEVKWTLKCEECRNTTNNKFTALKPRVLNLPEENVTHLTYICEMSIIDYVNSNMLLSPQWEWSLIVYKPLVASINASETVYSRTGDNVTLECSATLPTNESSIAYTWYREGNEHTTGSHLFVENMTLAQSGEYRCTASVNLDNDTRLEANATVNLLVIGNITKFQLEQCSASGNVTLEFSSRLPNEAKVEAKVDGDDNRIPLYCDQKKCHFMVETFKKISFAVSIGNNYWSLETYTAPTCTDKEDEVELRIQLENCPDQRDLDQGELAKFLRMKCKLTKAQVCPQVTVTDLSCNNGLLLASVRGRNVLSQINRTCDEIKTAELFHRRVQSCIAIAKEKAGSPFNIWMVLIKVLFALVGALIIIAFFLISVLFVKILKKKCPKQNDLEAQRHSQEPNHNDLTEEYRRNDNLSCLNEHAPLPHQVELVDQTPSLPSYNTAVGGNKTSSRRSRDKTPSKGDNRDREPSQGAQSKCSRQSCNSCSCSANSQRFIQMSENSGIFQPLQIPRHPTIDTRTTAVVFIPVREQAVHLPYTTCSRTVDSNRPFNSI